MREVFPAIALKHIQNQKKIFESNPQGEHIFIGKTYEARALQYISICVFFLCVFCCNAYWVFFLYNYMINIGEFLVNRLLVTKHGDFLKIQVF